MSTPRISHNRPHDLERWPLQELAQLDSDELTLAVESLDLHHHQSWICDQILAHFGRWKVVEVEGQADCRETVRENCLSNPWMQGLWQLSCRLPRGMLVPKQISQPQFSALVPLIWAGLRLYQDLEYHQWSREHLSDAMNPELAEAMSSPWPEWTREEILGWRAEGLLIRSGSRMGQSRAPQSSWQLYGIQHTPLAKLPHLQRCMVAQTWVCHPDIRHRNMVCHSQHWSEMPPPLVSADPISGSWDQAPWNQK